MTSNAVQQTQPRVLLVDDETIATSAEGELREMVAAADNTWPSPGMPGNRVISR